jgi:hypothetical protein
VFIAKVSVSSRTEKVNSALKSFKDTCAMNADDEFILAWARTFPPAASEGWTIHFIERTSRYWVDAQAGLKDASLFEKGVKAAWNWAKPSKWVRWFTEVERRYGKELWKLASVYLTQRETTESYGYRKVWREGLEVAIKVKGSQG